MPQDLTGALKKLAEQLRDATPSERVGLTRDFHALSLQFRAALPPLLLPHRAPPDGLRFGYVMDREKPGAGSFARDQLSMRTLHRDNLRTGAFDRDEVGVGTLDSLAGQHVARGEAVWLFLLDGSVAPVAGATVISLAGIHELQAARAVARADLDVLMDVAGAALARMPLLIALRPARVVVETSCTPMFAGDHVAIDALRGIDVDRLDPSVLVDIARRAVPPLMPSRPSLPAGLDPQTLQARVDEAIQSHRNGALDTARGGYERVLALYPSHPVAAYLLGQLLHQQRKTIEAISHLQNAVQAAPEFRDAHYTLAQRLADLDRWEEAASAYRSAVQLTPDFAAGWSGLGLATLRGATGDTSAAVTYLERAASLEPETPQWQFNLGTAHQRAGNLGAARRAYEAVLAGNPDDIEARFNLGAVLQQQAEYGLAIAEYKKIIERQPDFAPAYPELGACLQLTAQVDAWRENFGRYRRHCPVSLSMAVYGIEASMADGDSVDHRMWLDGIVAGKFVAGDTEEFLRCWEQLLFLLLHVDVDRAKLCEWYRLYDTAASKAYGPRFPLAKQRRAGPVRLGYLSGDFRDHVMGRMIFEWVGRHDPSRFEVTLYSLAGVHDKWTDRFRALPVRWVELDGMSLHAASDKIRADDIDILIDCSGHTRGARPGILARKPARIQITHIATPGPVGLRAIDYKLTDIMSEADDAQRYSVETLMPVPGGVFPWYRYGEGATRGSTTDGRVSTAGARISTADARISTAGARISTGGNHRRGRIMCGAFVSLMKLSPRCLGLWSAVLEAIPDAVLAFSPPHDAWQPAYVRWLGAHGIASDRITFIPYAADEPGRLARYEQLDVVLDPMPCGNVNGTMEALSMGVPVVTLAGTRHGERLGHALLTRFGITDTIAHSDAEYVAIVARLAGDPVVAARLRAQITQLAIASPVWHSESQVRHVEAVFDRMLLARGVAIDTA